MSEHLIVSEERAGLELDEFLCLIFPYVSKGFLRGQVREGRVLLDGEPSRPSQRLRTNQVVSIEFEAEDVPAKPVARSVQVPILYEDDAVMVVDKPAGLAVEPERWHRDAPSLSGSLLAEAVDRATARAAKDDAGAEDSAARGIDSRPRLVHRIDKDTTGCVLVAKTLPAERELRQAFENPGTITKSYIALVEGEYPVRDEADVIDRPIAPDPRKSGRMCVDEAGKPARTRVEVEECFAGYTLVRCEPLTGRTHQIRVHLSDEGFPLAVDRLYGRRDGLLLSSLKRGYRPKKGTPEQPLIGRLTLHAASLEIPDLQRGEPGNRGETLRVESPLPKDFLRTLKQLRKVRPGRP